LISGEPGCNK
jgi:hypothetical protein